MPAFGVEATVGDNEMPAVQPFVKINKSTCPYVFCAAIEDSGGVVPSKAMIRYGSNTLDISAPNTLNKKDWPWTRGSKVEIYNGDSDYMFRGLLVRRHDQGEYDSVMWEAWDYRHLLNFIPVRGCLVYDPTDDEVKFIPRYVTRFNPGGNWNCIGATINGVVYPVFSTVSDIGKTYQSPDQVFSASTELAITAWTPRRALQYLQLLSTIEESTIKGAKSPEWRSLSNSPNLEWPVDSLNISSVDLSQAYDPLDRKLADITIQGGTMANAIAQVLKAVGTHGLGIRHDSDKSRLFFYPKQIAQPEDGNDRLQINLFRSGEVDDVNTAFDFEVYDDVTELAESVLVEGSIIHVESEFEYDPDNPTTCTIQPEWTALEQTAFLTGIKGTDVSGTRYATYPKVQGDTDTTAFLTADGSGGNLKVLAGSDEAVKLLRRCFPRVFRCFSISSANAWTAGIMKGIDNIYEGAELYPYLKIPRGVLLEQAQYFTENFNRLLEKLPVRVKVKTAGVDDAKGHDVTEATGLRVTPDGRIWLEGLCDTIDGQVDCIYEPALQSIVEDSTLSNWKVKKFQLNARIPLDFRVQGYGFLDGKDRALDSALARELGGPLMQYVDSPDAYVEEHQKNSTPGPNKEYYQDDDKLTAPLNRYLPPGSEVTHAEFAAQRKLATVGAPRKSSTWHMVGIRPEYRAGLWVQKIKMIGASGNDTDYDINAPIEQVTWDFLHQRTLVGGLISQLARIKAAKPNKKVPAASVPSAKPSTFDGSRTMSVQAGKGEAGYVEDE